MAFDLKVHFVLKNKTKANLTTLCGNAITAYHFFTTIISKVLGYLTL